MPPEDYAERRRQLAAIEAKLQALIGGPFAATPAVVGGSEDTPGDVS